MIKNHRLRFAARFASAALLTLFASTDFAAEVVGVKLSNTLQVGQTTLELNGAALRKVVFFKIYVVALYLPQPTKNADEAIYRDQPKALVFQFLRDVNGNMVREGIRDAFMKNAGDKVSQHQADVDRFLNALPNFHAGDRISFIYEPANGTSVIFPDSRITFAGSGITEIFLLTYLGPKPPTAEVKNSLLGIYRHTDAAEWDLTTDAAAAEKGRL